MKKKILATTAIFFLCLLRCLGSKPDYKETRDLGARFVRLFEGGDCISLIKTCDSVISQPDAAESHKLMALDFKGRAQMALRRYDETIATLKYALSLPKADSLLYWDVGACIGLNDIYCTLNDFEDAEEILNKAESIIMDPRWKKVHPISANNKRSALYGAKSILKKAQNNIPGAMTEWMKTDTTGNSSSVKLIWLGHGGALHLLAGDTLSAIRLYNEGLRQNTLNPNKLIIVVNLAEIMNNRGDFKGALKILGEHRALAESIHDPAVQKDYLLTLSVALRGVGKESEALAYMQDAMILSDSVAKSDRSDLNGILAGKANREQLENVEKDLDKTRDIWHVTIIVTATLLSVLGLWIIMLLRNRRKSQNRINDLEENISSFDSSHTAKLLELEEQIESHSTQLCKATLRIAKIDSGLREIQKEIDNTHKPSEERVAAIRLSLIEMGREAKSIKRYDILLNKESKMLRETISIRHPDLTKAELDMCCLIAAGLTNGEIAEITQRSIRTIEAIKYSLRKKINITESTDSYIREILRTLKENKQTDGTFRHKNVIT